MELKVKGLCKTFGNLRAADSVNFELGEGEIWGFIGPNGAGKTTTLRMLATVEVPTSGDAWLDGVSLFQESDAVRPKIGFMPDYLGTYPDMLVEEYLDFFARAYNLRGAERRKRLDSIIDFIEIRPLLEKKVTDLSKGMRQRISLARAIINNPKLLLLDEPASGLDPQARRDLRELLKVLAAEKTTILISSHILSELEDLVHKVVIINNGKVVYSGTPYEHQTQETEDSELDINVLGSLQAGMKLLLELPCVKNVTPITPDLLRIKLTGGRQSSAEVVKKLVENGLMPYNVTAERKSLEKMFLEKTSKRIVPDEMSAENQA